MYELPYQQSLGKKNKSVSSVLVVSSWHISYCPQEKEGIKEIWSLTVNHLPATPYMT